MRRKASKGEKKKEKKKEKCHEVLAPFFLSNLIPQGRSRAESGVEQAGTEVQKRHSLCSSGAEEGCQGQIMEVVGGREKRQGICKGERTQTSLKVQGTV